MIIFSVVIPFWIIWSFLLPFLFIISLPFKSGQITKHTSITSPPIQRMLNFWFCLHVRSVFWVLLNLCILLWVTPTFSSSCMCVGMCACAQWGLELKTLFYTMHPLHQEPNSYLALNPQGSLTSKEYIMFQSGSIQL